MIKTFLMAWSMKPTNVTLQGYKSKTIPEVTYESYLLIYTRLFIYETGMLVWICDRYHSTLVGTKGSKPSSSTGITNSASFPSYALTIWVCALRICCNWFCNYEIMSFLPFYTSSIERAIAPIALPSMWAALSTSFNCKFFTSSYSFTAPIFFSRIKFCKPSCCWIA